MTNDYDNHSRFVLCDTHYIRAAIYNSPCDGKPYFQHYALARRLHILTTRHVQFPLNRALLAKYNTRIIKTSACLVAYEHGY